MAPVSVVVGGIAAAALFVAMSPMARAAIGAAASPTLTPTPTPTHAYIVLDTAAGGPKTKISVSGSSFAPGVAVSLYWDTTSQVAGSTSADSGGSFTASVIPFPGSSPGAHKLCASAEGLNQSPPCANFTLQGAPTPTPAASPSASASPSSSPSPSPTASASPVVLTSNSGRGGFDVITRPPFIFLPIIALLALLAALAYWLLMRVDRTPVLPAASVVHRSARPDMGPKGASPNDAPIGPPAAQMEPPPAGLPPPYTPPDDDDAGSATSGEPEPPAY